MKKELRILVILIAVLLVGTVGYYFMPKKFGKNVNPSEVDHINVFDGNTGTGFTITDSEDIEYIVANIQGISMKRDGISLGRTGYSFKISYINSNDKDIIPVFILKFYIYFLIIRINTILSSTLKYRKILILPRIYHDSMSLDMTLKSIWEIAQTSVYLPFFIRVI